MSAHLTCLAAAALAGALPASLAAQPATAVDSRVTEPDWRGIWFLEGAVPGINGFPEQNPTTPGGNPLLDLLGAPWTEEGMARVQALIASQGDDKAMGWGYPMMMSGSAPLQFLVTPHETLILNAYRDVRHVYTDGRPLPSEDDRWPTTWGESVGRWEGDTLVVETVSVDEPTKYFFITPPLSPLTRYVERIRLVAPGRIENEMTIEDPVLLREPWTVRMAYTRAEGLDRLIHEAFVNDRSKVEDGLFTIEPPNE